MASTTATALDNLVRIGQLKAEPRNDAEVQRMLAMAQTRLSDARLAHVSQEGRFTSVYNAAHAAALAALVDRLSQDAVLAMTAAMRGTEAGSAP